MSCLAPYTCMLSLPVFIKIYHFVRHKICILNNVVKKPVIQRSFSLHLWTRKYPFAQPPCISTHRTRRLSSTSLLRQETLPGCDVRSVAAPQARGVEKQDISNFLISLRYIPLESLCIISLAKGFFSKWNKW